MLDRHPLPEPYSSGERVFGPPGGTFDADWAATALRSLRPELDHARSVVLTTAGWQLVRTRGLRGAALVRTLTGPDVDDALAGDVAAVVTETVRLYGA